MCVCVCVCVCVCGWVGACMRACVRACVHWSNLESYLLDLAKSLLYIQFHLFFPRTLSNYFHYSTIYFYDANKFVIEQVSEHL